jgi:transcriptional regulator with XRE-family HTH domain
MMSEQKQTPAEEMLRWHDFGAWLTQRRLELGYTQAHVAGRAGISVQNLVSLEHGGFRRRAGGPWILPNPQDDILRALARIYRVSAEELFGRVGRYADRPQTKSGLRRRASGSRRMDRSDRLAELEAKVAELEAQARRTEQLFREHGIGLPDSAERPQRQRASGVASLTPNASPLTPGGLRRGVRARAGP